ncbi:MAG: hypothetical protein L0Y79_03405 [Chlorobi bacterium]|nr:hypothetical protein [Chlorobiota bacterium]MCI0715940.1 hypothetical protein [Chlorobiota bacterium]
MVPEIRKKYNSEFTDEKFLAFLDDLNSSFGFKIDFRIAETPIFIGKEFKNEILKAVGEITGYLTSDDYKKLSLNAIPQGNQVPNDPGYTDMIALDFAICKDEKGNFIPQLIELQGFSSLFFYELLQNAMYRKHFDIPERFGGLFGIHKPEEYIEVLRSVIVGDSNPENVILLEIEPEKQKTRIDFECCYKFIGVKPVCLTKVKKEGKDLFYESNGRKIKIERIYNRVIFDELNRREDLNFNFSFFDELNIKWIPHPNWFFRISKYTLPFLKSKYVPDTNFLSDFDSFPDDLENYVLKPLFSFAGVGVQYDVTKEVLDKINDRQNYILQRKIIYEPVIETPDVPAKAELRLLFVHNDGKPYLINNLVRLSKGKMMGVDFNKEKTWVGSSLAYFEHL